MRRCSIAACLVVAALAVPGSAAADVAPLKPEALDPAELCGRDCAGDPTRGVVTIPDVGGEVENAPSGQKWMPWPEDADGDGIPNEDDTFYPWPEDFGGHQPSPEDIDNHLKDLEAQEASEGGLIDPWANDEDGDGIPDEDDTINPFADDNDDKNRENQDKVNALQAGVQPADRSCTIKCLGITSGAVSDAVTGALPPAQVNLR